MTPPLLLLWSPDPMNWADRRDWPGFLPPLSTCLTMYLCICVFVYLCIHSLNTRSFELSLIGKINLAFYPSLLLSEHVLSYNSCVCLFYDGFINPPLSGHVSAYIYFLCFYSNHTAIKDILKLKEFFKCSNFNLIGPPSRILYLLVPVPGNCTLETWCNVVQRGATGHNLGTP